MNTPKLVQKPVESLKTGDSFELMGWARPMVVLSIAYAANSVTVYYAGKESKLHVTLESGTLVGVTSSLPEGTKLEPSKVKSWIATYRSLRLQHLGEEVSDEWSSAARAYDLIAHALQNCVTKEQVVEKLVGSLGVEGNKWPYYSTIEQFIDELSGN